MRRSQASPATLLAALALTCLCAVGAAVVSQHAFGMLPCPWCVLQRLIFVLVAAVCVLGLFWNGAAGQRVSGVMLVALGAGGVGAALWQHFVAASSKSCIQTLADRILNALALDALFPNVFMPMASCADAAVKLFGVPYEFYSLVLFVLVLAVGARLVLMRR